MTTLYCSYVSETWVTRQADPNDRWDSGDEGGRYDVTGVYLTGGMRDIYETPEEIAVGDKVFVVYVSYGSGSTFGTTGGYGQIVAITKSDFLALAADQWCHDVIHNYGARNHYYRREEKVRNLHWPTDLPVCHPYFTGYFEHSQRVELRDFIVQ